MNKISYLLLCALVLTAVSCKKSGSGTDIVTPPNQDPTEVGLITVSPGFPTDNQEVSITFDASKGNKGLAGYSGDVYMHTGVITDKSSGPTDWKYVKSASFNTADAAVKMLALGSGKFKLTLSPRTFYGVPVDEKILYLAMVFRSTDGSVVGRNTDASDIYTPIYESAPLQVKFLSPEIEPTFIPKPVISVLAVGGQLVVKASSSRSADLTLSLNDQSFATATNATTVSGTATIAATGLQKIKISANENGTIAEKVIEFIVNGTPVIEALPPAAKDGVTMINNGTSAIFNLYAPGKSSVYLIGDFNNWQLANTYALKRTPDGNRWWIQINNLNPQTEYAYQYYVDGSLRIPDPYAELILDPSNDSFISQTVYPGLKTYPSGKTTGLVSVFQPNPSAYSWQVSNFSRPDKTDLVIYELHIRDFVTEHTYAAAIQKLNYLQSLGINAVELMPVYEFEGNSSWGYNSTFYFAPDKYYGTKQALQSFIDECHKRGMAVIIDMVLNHSFGSSPMVQLYWDKLNNRPASNNPWFNQADKHPYGVGYDFNHESAATKYFAKNVMKFWVEEYKIDGFRFDLSKGFTQTYTGTDVGTWGAYDASRIAIWKDYNTFIKSLDPNLYVILEHFAADSEEKILAEDGMMLWNNLNYNYNQATMGFSTSFDLSRSFYSPHGFTSASQDKLITYMESHDEERLMYKNLQYGNISGNYSIKNLATALKRQEMAAALFLATPGPKMIWQFGELGYDVSINYNGRLAEKPIRWNYFDDSNRKALYNAMAKIINLKKTQAAFKTNNFTYSLSGSIKHIILNGSPNVVVVGNFDVTSKAANITFPANGTWYDYMSPGQTEEISGAYTKTLAPGEYHIYTSANLN